MTSHLNKQVQLMMNLSLLSSLNQKTIPTIPQYHPLPLPQTQPVYQIIHQPLTQMSYHSMISPKTTLLSYDVNQVPTNDCSINNGFVNSLYCSSHPKANTVMSYQLLNNHHVHPHVNYYYKANDYQTQIQSEFIGKKIKRNDIIINEEETLYDDVYQKVYKEFKEQTRLIHEDDDSIQITKNKHHSAPIKMHTHIQLQNKHCNKETLHENKQQPVFETHLLKCSLYEHKEKKYKCNHPTCEFSYRTRKQKVSHHSKMDLECQKDSVAFLRLISSQKEIINKLIKDNKIHDIEKIKHINNKIAFMKKNISISDYAQMICKGSIQIKDENNFTH
jgi:hypothetical protein